MISWFIQKTEEEHDLHLRLVLDKLMEYKYYVKLTKCTFCLSEVAFLGHVIN
jgi:hypothetical protein